MSNLFLTLYSSEDFLDTDNPYLVQDIDSREFIHFLWYNVNENDLSRNVLLGIRRADTSEYTPWSGVINLEMTKHPKRFHWLAVYMINPMYNKKKHTDDKVDNEWILVHTDETDVEKAIEYMSKNMDAKYRARLFRPDKMKKALTWARDREMPKLEKRDIWPAIKFESSVKI
jgi:hypothetical protein